MISQFQNSNSPYTDRERFFDNAIHVLGVVSSVIGIGALIGLSVFWRDATTVLSVSIYGVSVVAVFAISAAYHLIETPALKAIFRRFDHAAIFVKIAGTYTPFALVRIGGDYGLKLLAVVWGIAIVGVTLKLGGWRFGEKLSATLYLAQGWMIVFAIGPFHEALEPSELILCIAGGLLYTIGVGFFLATRLAYHNAIWHAFVLSASTCFYVAILKAVVLR